MNDPTVRTAMEAARRNEPQTLDLQVHVCEIPAPPFKEEVRGARAGAFHSRADALIAAGLALYIDRAQKLCRYFQTNGQG
jgi:hypothetical protein